MANQVVVFELDGILFGIDILEVQEIIRMMDITPLSSGSATVEGIINLRGLLIPVVNLSRLMGFTEKNSEERRIVIVKVEKGLLGLMVDRVLEVGTYEEEEEKDTLDFKTDSSFIKAVIKKGEQLWLLLNLKEVA